MSIDWWSLGIQTVNIGILVWLLRRFFWRPVAGIIAQRRKMVADALAKATETDAKATAALAEVEKTRAGFAAERDTILKQAQDDADRASAATQADAASRVAELEAAATAAIATEKANAAKAWTERSGSLAVDIAGRLASRLDGPSVQASFLGWLLGQLRSLPDSVRHSTDGTALEVVSAKPIDADEQARVTGLIAEALGTAPTITYRTDVALIAGLELHGPHLAVTNSWQADLAKIMVDAAHDTAG